MSKLLAATVLLHLAVMLAHGSAHASAGVVLAPAALAFVIVVVGIGPLAGVAWMLKDEQAGARIVGASMAASFVFGLFNHFLVAGADHVAHVPAPSRMLFGATAALLALSEAAGALLGIAIGWRSGRGVA
jgi:hypothetical protein